MKARKNPTKEQLLRRLRRRPDSPHDPRFKIDPYWVARHQGHPHSYAKKAFRDQLPVTREYTVDDSDDEYTRAMDEVFFPAGSKVTRIEIEFRPDLSEVSIRDFAPRGKEDYLWDKDVPGFAARVRQTGYKCYVVFYRVRHSKRLRKFTIGSIAEFSLEQARSVARDIRRQARMGTDPVIRMRE